MFPSTDAPPCSLLPSNGYRGRSFRKPCGSPPSQVLRGRKTARPSVLGRLPVSLGGRLSTLASGDGELSWVRGKSLETCPELGTPAIPGRPSQFRSYPDAAFRSPNGVGIRNRDRFRS